MVIAIVVVDFSCSEVAFSDLATPPMKEHKRYICDELSLMCKSAPD